MPTPVQPGGAYVETPPVVDTTPTRTTEVTSGAGQSAADLLSQYRTAGYTVTPAGSVSVASIPSTTTTTTGTGNAATQISRSAYQAQVEAEAAISLGKTIGTIKYSGDKVLQSQFNEYVGRRMQAYDSGYLNVTTGVKQSDLDKVYNDTIAKAKSDLSGGTSNDLLSQIKSSLASLTGLGRGGNQLAGSPQFSSATVAGGSGGPSWIWLALAVVAVFWFIRRGR